MTEIALFDTHALIWWVAGDAGRLGRAVACVSTLSLVELGDQTSRGRVRLPKPFTAFVADLESTPGRYSVVPFPTAMALRAQDQYGIPERADRLIAATALELGYPLVSRDPEIVAAIGGEHLW